MEVCSANGMAHLAGLLEGPPAGAITKRVA